MQPISLTQIILAVITLIIALVTRYAIPFAKQKMDENQLEMLRIAVKTAVYAAEKIYGSKQGQEKLNYVVEVLKQQGYEVDMTQIADTTRALIEAAVKELELEQKEETK